MYHALTILEIVEEIVRHAALHNLSRIMLTCWPFYHPALGSLCQRGQSLDALASLLPNGLVLPDRLVDLFVSTSASRRLLFLEEQTATLSDFRRIRRITFGEDNTTDSSSGEGVEFPPPIASAPPNPQLPWLDQHLRAFHIHKSHHCFLISSNF